MNQDKNRDKVIEQIIHLLAIAEGKSTNPNEAAVAAVHAQKLMYKYKITREDVAQSSDNGIRIHEEPIIEGKRINSWELGLANAISQENGCLNVMITGDQMKKVVIVGKEEDALVVRALYNYLHKEIEFLTKRAQAFGTIYGRDDANSFRLGALVTIVMALREAKKSIATEYGSTAIVKIEKNAKEAEEWAEEFLPGINMNKKRRVEVDTRQRAFRAGMVAGQQVDIVDPKKILED